MSTQTSDLPPEPVLLVMLVRRFVLALLSPVLAADIRGHYARLQLIESHGPNTDQYVGVRVVSLATTTTTVFLGLLSRFNGIYAF